MEAFDWYILLILVGFLLIALEVFIIGGVLGVLGGICLLGAAGIGFQLYGLSGGMISLLGLMVGTCAFLFTWIKVFPNTPLGKSLTLNQSINEEKGVENQTELLDKIGEAITDLRPGGIVRIDNQRVDVQALTGWVDKGSNVQVVEVQGITVIVKQI